jgi:hypothetical protein
MDPPIRTISFSLGTISGCFTIASATLVSGPIGHSVTVPGGCRMISLTITSTAWPSATEKVGSGRLAPSRPDYVRATGERKHAQRVAGGQGQPDIAGDRGDRRELDLLRRGEGEEDRDRVVLTRVAIEDDAVLGHLSLR